MPQGPIKKGAFLLPLIISLTFIFQSELVISQNRDLNELKIIMWHDGYYHALIRLAMQKTPSEGSANIISLQYNTEFSRDKMTQKRMLSHLEKGEKLHIKAIGVTQERLNRFIPIRIPLLKGTLGIRVFLIHKDNQRAFSNIRSFADLQKNFVAGFGEQWSDISILRANGLNVSGVAKPSLLPQMLSRKRYDFFPLEAQAAYSDEYLNYTNIQVEPDLALYYVYPRYFFISKNQPELADRVNRGLQLALEDGSFDRLFFEYNAQFLIRSNLSNRKILKHLDNPNFPKSEKEPDISWLYSDWQ